MSKNYAVIVAAGKGKRMGTKISKQFLELANRPILYHTLHAFSECPYIDGIILVLSPESIEYCKTEIVEKYKINKIKALIPGGTERQNSVYKGLLAADGCEIVLIHDGARPFVNKKIISDGIEYARLHGAASCGVRPKDTIKFSDSQGFAINTPDRSTLFAVQTPQCFKYDLILDCHKKLQNENVVVTDDTMVVERYGHKVFLYEGEYSNIKITTPEDIVLAESLFKMMSGA